MTTSSDRTASRKAVRRAGDILRSRGLRTGGALEASMDVLSQWRQMHDQPARVLESLVKKRIGELELRGAVTALRFKRTPSIVKKLIRFPNMQLDRMQDIGGIRVILANAGDLRRLHAAMTGRRCRHAALAPKDCFENPKADGCRGIRQVFRYNSSSSRYGAMNGLQVEIQF